MFNRRGPMAHPTLMLQEASQAPQLIANQKSRNRKTVQRIVGKLVQLDPRVVITCARGSSDHAATYAKYIIETHLGVAVCSFAPSVASVYGAKLRFRGAPFFVISQSGRSPDLLRAALAAREAGAYVVAIVNDEESPLAKCADDLLPISAGIETSVAATKSCLGAMSAIFDLCAVWRSDEKMSSALDALPETLQAAFNADWSHALDLLASARQSLLISRGVGLAGVQEAALKLKETCRIQAEAFSSAEVRHGPMAIIDSGFPVIFASTFDAGQSGIDTVARLFIEREALVFTAGEAMGGAYQLPLPRAPLSDLQPLVFLQAFYRFANSLSLARGLDPDKPEHLQKVTETV